MYEGTAPGGGAPRMPAGKAGTALRACVAGACLSALLALIAVQTGAPQSELVGEFNMAGPTPRDLPWADGLVVHKRTNTPPWPAYQEEAPWPPQQMTVEELYRALRESREYQGSSWVRDASTPTGYRQALDPERVPFLLDVREEDEYAAARIADATNIPLSALQARLAEIPRDRPLLVVCQSGKSACPLGWWDECRPLFVVCEDASAGKSALFSPGACACVCHVLSLTHPDTF